MEVSYATMIAVGTLVQRLGRDASRYQAALAEAVNEAAEWKRIADELKAERNALRSTAGHLLDAFGSLANEPRHGATDDEYRDRIVTKIHTIKLERDALRAECDDLRRVFALVHGSLGIQQGEHIGNAIDALKKERDELATWLRLSIARGDFAEMRLATLAAELETERERHRQTAAVPQSVDAPRAHPVKVGEWVERTSGEYSPDTKIGAIAQVIGIDEDGDYEVSIDGTKRCWSPKYCSPCDPPESTHDTPEGKQAAESVIRDDRKTEPDEIKVGDVVRATFWKAGQAAVVKEILADGRLMLDCSDQPWRVDEVVKLMRKVTP